jgi:hypothetical protein
MLFFRRRRGDHGAREDRNINGLDHGNGAAPINHSRRHANCCVLRENGRVWIIAGIEEVEAGAELT